jgi:ribose 5-phosphate isomerase B
MRIAIASEHAGFELKEKLVTHLRGKGISLDDLGARSDQPIDYPAVASDLAERVARGEYTRGILICGTGIGMSIAAGKIPGIRAALCTDPFMARMCREHNDANVLCLGAWITGSRLSIAIVDAYLETRFAGDRHQRRVSQIREIELRYRAEAPGDKE